MATTATVATTTASSATKPATGSSTSATIPATSAIAASTAIAPAAIASSAVVATTTVISSATGADKAVITPTVAITPVRPWPHAEEDAVIEIPWPVVTVRGAGIRRIVVITVGADGRTYADANLRICYWH